MNNPRDIDIPKIDLLQDLRTTLEDTIVIIRKMEINLGKEKTNLLISLVEDALFFLERREPKSFPVYLTHSLREMIDKFYNLNIDTYEEEEFEVIERRKLPINSEKKLKKYTIGLRFIKIEQTKLVWKGLMSNNEKQELLEMYQNPIWERAIWSLWNKCGRTESMTSKYKMLNLLHKIGAKYGLKESQFNQLLKEVKELYSLLSKYAHISTKSKELIEIFIKLKNKEELGSLEEEKIKAFNKEVNAGLSIFNYFKFTTSEKIDQLNNL